MAAPELDADGERLVCAEEPLSRDERLPADLDPKCRAGAEAAGILGGAWTVRAAIEEGWAPIAAGLLILAGPDRDLLQRWVDRGRERAGQAGLRAGGDR